MNLFTTHRFWGSYYSLNPRKAEIIVLLTSGMLKTLSRRANTNYLRIELHSTNQTPQAQKIKHIC